MLYPLRIFSRFSWKKIMAATFSSKLFILRRMLWALLKIPVILLPLIIVGYFAHRIAALFAKIFVKAGKIIKRIGDNDVVLRLMWTGLTAKPLSNRASLYAAYLRKARLLK